MLLFLLIDYCLSYGNNSPFPAPYSNYPEPDDSPLNFGKIKCSTCCKVLFVSNFDFQTNQVFTDKADQENHIRYAFNMEFDQMENVRKAEGNYEQAVLLRPIEHNPSLAYFELYPYKMINSFLIPKRVLDIKGGSKAGSNLIIWKKKDPLLPTTDNQRFVYHYPYDKSYYNTNTYPRHFYLPFSTGTPLCFEAMNNKFNTWTGNKDVVYSSEVFQIMANNCDSNNPKQIFELVFA
jgi:galactose-inhibitable lectin light subunit